MKHYKYILSGNKRIKKTTTVNNALMNKRANYFDRDDSTARKLRKALASGKYPWLHKNFNVILRVSQ